MNADSGNLLTDLLKQVSRSFYLTLRVLPATVRPQIGLAYLLARATDTIADTEIVPVEQRLEALLALRARILGDTSRQLDPGDLGRHQSDAAERTLLVRLDEALRRLDAAEAWDRDRIREVLDIITSGQELDLKRFGHATESAQPIALPDAAALDYYTYRVAGCVGEFWTRLCRRHVFPKARLDDDALLRDGVRFGKGLQLVNILRDLPRDLRQGRCYLPGNGLAPIGLRPRDLLDPRNEPKLRPLYDTWLDTAQAHLAAGWDYTTALPWASARVRLACAWPVLIGAQTLGELRHRNILDPAQRTKVSRAGVRNILLRSILLYPFSGAWRGQFTSASAKNRSG